MVCPECGLTAVARNAAECPRCEAQFARPVRGLGWAMFALFVLMTGVLAVVLVMQLRGASRASLTEAERATLAVGAVLATVYLIWFSRIRHNAAAWAPQSYGPVWVVGAWFLPGGFVWIPFRMTLEAWWTTFESKTESWTLYLWWACWLATWLTTLRLHQVTVDSPRGPYGETVFSVHPFNVLQLGFAIAAAVLAAMIVRQLSRAQDAWIAGKVQQPII